MAKPDVNKASQQDEFHVDMSTVLEAFVDADEVQEDDKWSFVDGGDHLIIVRRRTTITDLKQKRAEQAQALAAIGVFPKAEDEESEE
jgi:hypothetical protein